jgi:hypothetical protein
MINKVQNFEGAECPFYHYFCTLTRLVETVKFFFVRNEEIYKPGIVKKFEF